MRRSSSKSRARSPTYSATSFGRLRRRFLLLRARAGEDSGQRVVAFVARVLVDLLVGRVHRDFAAERLRERVRILDREAIQDLVRTDAREALGHLQVLAAEPRKLWSGRKFVVSTTSVSPSHRPMESPIHVRTLAGRCLPFEPHDARVVHHLDEDHHRVLRLHDLVVVVVQQRDHRRSRARAERQDAALAERAHLRTVGSAAAAVATPERGHALRHALLARVGHAAADVPFGGSTSIELRRSPLSEMSFVPGSTQKLL